MNAKDFRYYQLTLSQFFLSCLALAGTVMVLAQTPVNVTATAASSRQAEYLGPQNIVSDAGLTADPNNPAVLRLSASAALYNSSYGTPNDETPLVHFDFGVVQTIDRFHVWNGNEPGYVYRGFRSVTIQYSNDAERWQTMPERFSFERAPGADGYAGQQVILPRPITARFVRFVCNGTWRVGGLADIASLGRVKFFAGGVPANPPAENQPLPLATGVVNVKMAPYFAKGDGRSDDTKALQQAILDTESTRRTIYLPEGIYLISAPLKFSENSSLNRNGRFGGNTLRGAGKGDSVIRLKDATLVDANAPQPVLTTGFISFFNTEVGQEQTTADWFNNNISDLTIDIGRGNPGAKGLEFYSNNTGSVRNVKIVSRDGQGVIGLDLGHLDKNGPLLVKGLTVKGFATGVRTAFTVNSQTFEHIRLSDQTQTAFDNSGQSVSIKGLVTRGQVTALHNRFGSAALIEAKLTGTGAASAASAIINGEYLFAHDVNSTGFARTVENKLGAGGTVVGSILGDYVSSGKALQLFDGPADFIHLIAPQTPTLEDAPPSTWVNVRDFRLTTEDNDAPAFQRAIDSGARDVYLPTDALIVLKSDVLVRGNVSLIHGMQAGVLVNSGVTMRVVNELNTPVVVLDQFVIRNGADTPFFVNESSRKMVLLDSEAGVRGAGPGAIFLENVVGRFEFGKHDTWARQLNSEPTGLKVSNSGGQLWILGLKTERAGTLVATKQGGITEVVGGLVYTTTPGNDPMFTIDDSTLSVSIAEIAYKNPPYATLVKETRQGVTRSLSRGEAPLRFDYLGGSALPLFVSRP
jgi:Pectate lyase superfamily protein/F5/8 type C domain